MSEATRNSLETTRGKLYEKSRYQILLPGKYQASKENTEIQLFNINRTQCSETTQHEDPTKDDHLEINDNEVRHSCFRVDDFNQNFPFVLSSIYNYRLPSSLHQPEPCVGEWENSSVLYKLKLLGKAGTQQRYLYSYIKSYVNHFRGMGNISSDDHYLNQLPLTIIYPQLNVWDGRTNRQE